MSTTPNPVPVSLHGSIPAITHPASTFTEGYSGGPGMSLGGRRGRSIAPTFDSPFSTSESQRARYTNRVLASEHRLFNDVPNGSLGSETVYRGVFLYNRAGVALPSLQAYLVQPNTGVTINLQLGSLDSLNTLTPIANETSSPGGVFTAPTSGSPMTLASSLAADGQVGLWVQRVVSSAAARGWDRWELVVTATGYDPRTFIFYHNLLAGVTSLTVTSNRDNLLVYEGVGETYTVNCKNGAGVLTDPGSNLLYVRVAGGNRSQYNYDPSWQVQNLVDTCKRSSTGVYTYEFHPNSPGFYQLGFDCGEVVAWVSRDVQPT